MLHFSHCFYTCLFISILVFVVIMCIMYNVCQITGTKANALEYGPKIHKVIRCIVFVGVHYTTSTGFELVAFHRATLSAT